jgi:hypothetical protein
MRWAYDSDGELGAIPASPFLLPAIIIYWTLSLFGAGKPTCNFPPTETIPSRLLADYRRRYHELEAITMVRPLTVGEELELYNIKYPCGDRYPPIHFN